MPEHMHWSRQRRPQPKAFRTASGYWLHWILRGNFNKSKQHSYLGYFHLPIPFKRPTKESHTQYKHNQLKNIRQPANDNSHNEVIQDTSVVSAASRWATGGHGWYHWPTPAMCRWVNCTWKTNFEGFKAMSLDMSKLDRGFTGFGVWCHAFCFVEANLQHTCGRVLHRRPWHRHQSWWNTASSNHHFSAGLSQLNDPQLGYPCLNSVISQFSNLSLIKKNLDFSPIHTPKFPPPFWKLFSNFFFIQRSNLWWNCHSFLAPRPCAIQGAPSPARKFSCPPAANVLRRPVRRPYDETGMWFW